ncbi:MAG: hypothetical protein GDA48_23115 [Hormoscilla sp. GM102CHS1]|nr:hypothetical protein [Hormoscilla sp. GM102CHS1]
MKQEVKKKKKQNKWQKLTFYTSLLLCATTFLLATGGLFLYSREQQQILALLSILAKALVFRDAPRREDQPSNKQSGRLWKLIEKCVWLKTQPWRSPTI